MQLNVHVKEQTNTETNNKGHVKFGKQVTYLGTHLAKI